MVKENILLLLIFSLLLFGCGNSDIKNFSECINNRIKFFPELTLKEVSLNNNKLNINVIDTTGYSNPINNQQRIEYLSQDIRKFPKLKCDSFIFIFEMPNRENGNISYRLPFAGVEKLSEQHNIIFYQRCIDTLLFLNSLFPKLNQLETLNIQFARVVYGEHFVDSAFFGINSFDVIGGFIDECSRGRSDVNASILNTYFHQVFNSGNELQKQFCYRLSQTLQKNCVDCSKAQKN